MKKTKTKTQPVCRVHLKLKKTTTLLPNVESQSKQFKCDLKAEQKWKTKNSNNLGQ